jgi:hypothetical protein
LTRAEFATLALEDVTELLGALPYLKNRFEEFGKSVRDRWESAARSGGTKEPPSPPVDLPLGAGDPYEVVTSVTSPTKTKRITSPGKRNTAKVHPEPANGLETGPSSAASGRVTRGKKAKPKQAAKDVGGG